MSPASNLTCRFCATRLTESFCDLGMSPLSNSFIAADQLLEMERFYPLHAYFCTKCFLVQVPEHATPAHIFTDYAYFSSYSDSWLAHSRRYVETMTQRLGLDARSHVVEIGSNDGYLLQYFKEKGIPVLGIEPAENVAKVALERGIPTKSVFLGKDTAAVLASEGPKADLLLANNVLAHVPDVNSFVAGFKILLGDKGLITVEFPHLMHLCELNQFDTIYHEHYSYLSLITVSAIFAAHGLAVFDVEELPTHGGSIRIYAGHASEYAGTIGARVREMHARERAAGLTDPAFLRGFDERAMETKRALLEFLIGARRRGKTVVGYGAPAKGNTLLNYCGVRADFLDYVVDRSPHKQGLFLPGTHIPIHAPEMLRKTRPDYVLILPWNLKDEIVAQMAEVREWGGRFVVPIPRVEVLP